MLAEGLLTDGIAHIGHLRVIPTVIIAAQFKDQGLHMATNLLLGDFCDNLSHPEGKERQQGSQKRAGSAKRCSPSSQYNIRLVVALFQLGRLHEE